MNALYECIEGSKIGIFESPTGTGKSLSLICGSLTWLREHKRREFDESLRQNDDDDDDDPEWMKEHALNERRKIALQHRQDLEKRLGKIRDREKKVKQKYENGEPVTKRRKVAAADRDGEPDEERFLLDDYESDKEDGGYGKGSSHPDGLSAETQALLQKLGMAIGTTAIEEETEMPDELKIFFCSRTHSQLSQFSNELRRVQMPPAIEPDLPSFGMEADDLSEEIKHLTLGSRKNLCINPNVSKLGSATAINERCLELQQSGTSADCKCPHLPNKENETLVNEFRDHALARIRDIEDLGSIGSKLGICPYYASRSAIRPSEVSLTMSAHKPVADKRPDCDIAIPTSSAKVSSRSAQPLTQRPCNHH